MKQRSASNYIGLIAAIILGFGIVAGVALMLRSNSGLGYQPNVLRATKTGPNSATLDLSTFPDGMVCHQGADSQQINWVSYCPTTSLEVPANSVITVVIKQYDSASTLVNDYFRRVQGTIGGVMMVNNKPFTQLSADQPGHTFTIQSPPDSPNPLFVNVPLLGIPDGTPNTVNINGNMYPKPNIITFQFRTGGACACIWHCYIPCGSDRGVPYGFSGPMSTTGFMAGTMTVVPY